MDLKTHLTKSTITDTISTIVENFRLKNNLLPMSEAGHFTRTYFDEKKETPEDIDWSEKTILIAEDEDTNFIYLETALDRTKVNMIRAKNGLEAVNMAQLNPKIDLILMDIKMPEMNGIEATRAIKSFRKDITIIAQTAFAMDEDKRNCMAVGCDEFLAKPVRYNLLINTLAKFL